MLEELRKAMAELRRLFAGNPVAEAQDKFHEAVHAILDDLSARVTKLERPGPLVARPLSTEDTRFGKVESHEG